MTNPYPGGQPPYPSGGQYPQSTPGGYPQQSPGQPAPYPASGPQQAYPASGPQQAYPASGPQQAYPASGPQQAYPQAGQPSPYGQAYPQAGQPSPYGQGYPQAGYPYPGQHTPVPRPSSVDRAFLLLVIALGVDFVGLLLPLLAVPASAGRVPATFGASLVVSLVIVVIKEGLWGLLIFLMRAGQNWARITMTVIGCIVSIFIVFAALTDMGLGAAVMSRSAGPGAMFIGASVLLLAGIGLMIAGFVCQYRASANRYFFRPPL